ncbi:MAG: alpha/beta hydrolase, partial [Oscillibacter sp.]
MKKQVSIWCLVGVLLLSGCGTPSSDAGSEALRGELPLVEILPRSPGSCQTQVSEFDLGENRYTAVSGKVMPYHLRGVVGVPEGEGPFPLVLLTHGSHNNLEEGLRYDTGFTYLVEALAQNGYVALSMDMGSAYLWQYGDSDDLEKSIYLADEHIKALRQGTGYPVELSGKINWDKVALAGHSRGGAAVFDIAKDQEKKGVAIGGVLAIAPTLPMDMETLAWDCPTSILVPEYDGDVSTLEGFAIDTALDEHSLHAVTFLLRANHNYFNANLTDNDALLAREETLLTDQLTAEQQRAFLADYTVDFCNAALLGQTEGTLYAPNVPLPNRMYGLDVMAWMSTGGESALVPVSDPSAYTVQNATVRHAKDSWFYAADTVAADTITFGSGDYQERHLLRVDWSTPESQISFAPMVTDFSRGQALNFRVLTDPADEKNQAGQSFGVVLTDAAGAKSRVTLPAGLHALRRTPGKLDKTPIDDKDYSFWSVPTPMGEVAIPLTLFTGVD